MNGADAVCLDACVAVKLVLSEPESEIARRLWLNWLDEDVVIWVPSLFFWECAHAVRGAYLRGDCDRTTASEAVAAIADLPVTVLPDLHSGLADIWERFVAGFDHQVSAYDAAYLAAGAFAGCELWTADERLLRNVGSRLPWVRSLGEAAVE